MRPLIVVVMVAAFLTACAPEVQEVTLRAVDIDFEPGAVTVKAGQPVRLTLENVGALEHDFNIARIDVRDVEESSSGGHGHSEAGLHVFAAPGGRATLEFTPLAPGEYEFYCSVAGHKEAGAMGTLIVK